MLISHLLHWNHDSAPAPKAPVTKARGMQLGRKQNNTDLFESLRSEVEAAPVAQQQQQHHAPAQPSYSAPAEPAFPMENVHVHIEEKITMVANRDGGLESMEVKGDLTLRVSDPALSKISLALRHSDDSNIQFKVCSTIVTLQVEMDMYIILTISCILYLH